jgi:hypothetical protein
MVSTLRLRVGEWVDRAEQQTGHPSATDIEQLKLLWEQRMNVLADTIPSNYEIKSKHPDPDWNSWASIAKCFEEYHTALADLQSAHAIPKSKSRLGGV